jgi:hypothetical protein
MGFAVESFSRRTLSVTTTNSHGLAALPEGERRAVSTMASIFSGSTGFAAYTLILRLFLASSLNILSPFSCIGSSAPVRNTPLLIPRRSPPRQKPLRLHFTTKIRQRVVSAAAEATVRRQAQVLRLLLRETLQGRKRFRNA